VTFKILFKKEWMEFFRTKKFLILWAVAFVVAAMSPLLAKFTPEILKMTMASNPALAGFELPTPIVQDSYLQLFKNLDSIFIIAVVLIFAGQVVEEKTKHTFDLVLTKITNRRIFMLSKILQSLTQIALVIAMMLGVFELYNHLFFKEASLAYILKLYLVIVSIIWFYYGMTFFASVVSKQFVFGLLWVLILTVIFNMLNFIPTVGDYLPLQYSSFGMKLITAEATDWKFYVFLCVSYGITALFLLLATQIFEHQEL